MRPWLGWLGFAGADALGRLALLTGATALFSRMMSPRDFGVAALALTAAAVGACFVGLPFEEALAQRRGLRRAHLSAALGLSGLIGVGVVAAAAGLGWALARAYGEPRLAAMVPAAMLGVFPTGWAAILTALARRLRRFNDVAVASLAGHLFGVVASLMMAWAGAGAWALIANRLLIALGVALALQGRLGFLILPRWSPREVSGFARFAGVSFFDRLADNLTYLLFSNAVAAVYGAGVLGYVNMAMRVVEPIRGAVIATGHNLTFSLFAPVAAEPRRLGATAASLLGRYALMVAPLFAGLAATAPTLTPLMAGPGWDASIGIAVCLALGAALAEPARPVFTALSAAARPDYALAATLASLAATLAALFALSRYGPLSVGLARIAGDAVRLALALGLAAPALGFSRGERARALLPALGLSLAMALAVAGFAPGWPPLARLAGMAVAGAAIYAALLAVFARAFFRRLTAFA
jgi:O-antigen/teichoic acid export membrane protein